MLQRIQAMQARPELYPSSFEFYNMEVLSGASKRVLVEKCCGSQVSVVEFLFFVFVFTGMCWSQPVLAGEKQLSNF